MLQHKQIHYLLAYSILFLCPFKWIGEDSNVRLKDLTTRLNICWRSCLRWVNITEGIGMGASAVAVYEGEAGRLYHHVKPGEEEVLRQRGTCSQKRFLILGICPGPRPWFLLLPLCTGSGIMFSQTKHGRFFEKMSFSQPRGPPEKVGGHIFT